MAVNKSVELNQEVSPSKMSSLSPKSWKNASSTSWEEFSKRVASFLVGESSLELKPAILSPAACARYGWKSVGKCILQCVACNAVLCGKLPFPWNSNAYNDCVENLVQSLKSSHKKNCPWLLAPSPEHFVRMHPMDKNEASSELIDRIESLLTLEALPVIENDVPTRMEITEKQIDALCQSSHLPSDKYGRSVIVLALTGWSRSPFSEKKKYLWCSHCQRIVALWFYTLTNASQNRKADEKPPSADPAHSFPQNNLANNNDTLSITTSSQINHCGDEKVSHDDGENNSLVKNDANLEIIEVEAPDGSCEEKEEVLSPPKKRCKMSSQDELDLFDPLYEHRHWCMWISQGAVFVENEDEENSRNFGWQIFLKSIMRGVESPFTSPELIKPVSKEKVKKARQMLENWS